MHRPLTISIFMKNNNIKSLFGCRRTFAYQRRDIVWGDVYVARYNKNEKFIVVFCVAVILAVAGIGTAAAAFARDGAHMPAAEGSPTFADRAYYTPKALHDPLAELGLKGKALEPDELKRILNENGYECEIRVTELDFDDLSGLKAYINEQKVKYAHLNQ